MWTSDDALKSRFNADRVEVREYIHPPEEPEEIGSVSVRIYFYWGTKSHGIAAEWAIKNGEDTLSSNARKHIRDEVDFAMWQWMRDQRAAGTLLPYPAWL